jgi:cytochrome c biogenesis protein CcmG/thiol:disulfide interchange protein DsbE
MTSQDPPTTPEADNKRDLSTYLPVAVGLVIVALLGYGLLSSHTPDRPQRGETAPDFALTLLDGTQITLSELRGQVVVLNFWASWCSPCRREAPALQSVWESYQDQGVAFVGVTYRDAKDASLAFIDEYGLTYPNGLDEMGRISGDYGVTAVPETYVIDRAGQVSWFRIGEVQADELAHQVELAGQ